MSAAAEAPLGDARRIAAALGRLRDAVATRPGFGCGAPHTCVSQLTGGVRAVSREKAFVFDTDLPPALGGVGSAPSPTALVRAALGACLAMGYQLRAAEAGVVLRAVRVTVDAESDVRGLLDADAGTPAGFTALRYHVEIDSPATHSELTRLVEAGDRVSPVLDTLTRALTVERTVAFGPLDGEEE